MNCRHCKTALEHIFLDLGSAPPSNSYVSAHGLTEPEIYYPLRLFVCAACWLVQTDDYAAPEEYFSANYAYFSSVSEGWVKHASRFCAMITDRLALNEDSYVIEVASNDGYLLKNFVTSGVPCLGIEPTHSTADAAELLGVPVLREFFSADLAERLATQGRKADLIVGNNVYAHVPDINDFTKGLAIVLKDEGTVTLEFPHLMRMIEFAQFDTVYHEHFSYLSLGAVTRVFEAQGLRVFDVEELPTHGGSLRVFGCHQGDPRCTTEAVEDVLSEEASRGLFDLAIYQAFQAQADKVKDDLVAFLIEMKRAGHMVTAYGAAAKGNTLLNYGGIKRDLIPFICDAAPSKQGKFTPGGHVPILAPDALRKAKPAFVLILPWNIADEVRTQCAHVAEWGGRFVAAVPHLRVLP